MYTVISRGYKIYDQTVVYSYWLVIHQSLIELACTVGAVYIGCSKIGFQIDFEVN